MRDTVAGLKLNRLVPFDPTGTFSSQMDGAAAVVTVVFAVFWIISPSPPSIISHESPEICPTRTSLLPFERICRPSGSCRGVTTGGNVDTCRGSYRRLDASTFFSSSLCLCNKTCGVSQPFNFSTSVCLFPSPLRTNKDERGVSRNRRGGWIGLVWLRT